VQRELGSLGAVVLGQLGTALENGITSKTRKADRALVEPTIGNDPALAFFGKRP
jgi:hypothetical protein